jgi:hypothetical protein
LRQSLIVGLAKVSFKSKSKVLALSLLLLASVMIIGLPTQSLTV